MGKCVQCDEFFAPHFMVDVELKEGELVKEIPQKCAYCHLDKTVVTMVNDETGLEEKISKEEAAKRYKIFMKKLLETKDIQAVLDKAKEQSSFGNA